jgi:hypothetical protein
VAGTPDGDHVEAVAQAPLPVEVLVVCAKLAEAPVSSAANRSAFIGFLFFIWRK